MLYDETVLDELGVKQIYKTMDGGKEWFCKWGQQAHTYTARPNDGDMYDPMVYYKGGSTTDNPEYIIYGSEDDPDKVGLAQFWGYNPRFYIIKYNDRNTPTYPNPAPTMRQGYGDAQNPYVESWGGFEATMYSYIIPPISPKSYSGLTFGGWTNHYPDYFLAPTGTPNEGTAESSSYYNPYKNGDYSSRCYYGSIQSQIGRAVHKKETAFPVTQNFPKWRDVFEKPTIDTDVWIGMKFICRPYPNENKVVLDLYMDKSNCENGGLWEKVLTNVDYDGYIPDEVPIVEGQPPKDRQTRESAQTTSQVPAGVSGNFWAGKVIKPNYYSTCHHFLVRIDSVIRGSQGGQLFKKFSVREIGDVQPPLPFIKNEKVTNFIKQ